MSYRNRRTAGAVQSNEQYTPQPPQEEAPYMPAPPYLFVENVVPDYQPEPPREANQSLWYRTALGLPLGVLHKSFKADNLARVCVDLLNDPTPSLVLHPTSNDVQLWAAGRLGDDSYAVAVDRHIMACKRCSSTVLCKEYEDERDSDDDPTEQERAQFASNLFAEQLYSLPNLTHRLRFHGYEVAVYADCVNHGAIAVGRGGLGEYFHYGDTPREAAESYIEFLEQYVQELCTTFNRVEVGFPYYDRLLYKAHGGMNWFFQLTRSLRSQLPSF